MVFAYSFIGFYTATFMFQWAHKHLLYPFNDLDFYSAVSAKKPYSEHLPFDFLRGHVLVKLRNCDLGEADFAAENMRFNAPLADKVREMCTEDRWFQYPHITSTYPEFYRQVGYHAVSSGLQTTKSYLTSENSVSYGLPGIEKVMIERAICVYPAYPLDVKPRITHAAARGVLDLESGNDIPIWRQSGEYTRHDGQ